MHANWITAADSAPEPGGADEPTEGQQPLGHPFGALRGRQGEHVIDGGFATGQVSAQGTGDAEIDGGRDGAGLPPLTG